MQGVDRLKRWEAHQLRVLRRHHRLRVSERHRTPEGGRDAANRSSRRRVILRGQPDEHPTAGLQKWVFNHTTNTWQLAYTINSGLGEPYAVSGLPSGDSAATCEPCAPATDGLRQLTGRIDGKDAVTLYATTSTVSGNMHQVADSTRLVEITDPLGATSQPSGEAFHTLSRASAGTLYRGISFTPGS